MQRVAWLALSVWLAASCGQPTFFCDQQSECGSLESGAVCEASGFCSFPDGECETERRYGALAPQGLAGTCVPANEPVSSTDIEAMSASGTSTGAPNFDSSTGAGDLDLGGSSSTGPVAPACCRASCSECTGECTPEILSARSTGESRSVAVSGETVVWATGVAGVVYTYDIQTGHLEQLASLPHSVATVTADEHFAYYLSSGEGFAGRIALSDGQASVIANPGDGAASGISFAAGSGQIAVDEDNVYFALNNTFGTAHGGAFVAPKDPVFGLAPIQIGTLTRPFGIDVDADFIFISDSETSALHRFPRLDPTAEGTELGPLELAGPVFVREDSVYAASDGQLLRFSKDGERSSVVASPGGRIGGIASDEADLYVTDLDANTVLRVPLRGGAATVLSRSEGPWGVAVSCDAVFWCEYGSRSLIRMAK